jgi:uracil-DNA glycosylase
MAPRQLVILEPSTVNTGGRTLSCVSCGLYREALTPKIEPFGNFQREIMIVGEGPGEVEDRRGRPFQGKTGTLLRDTLEGMGIDLFEDCVSLNAVNCRPPGNRGPTPHELNCCRYRMVDPAIRRYSPRLIMVMGGSAVASVIGSLYANTEPTIGKWRGFVIPVPQWGAWICPTFHPSYVAREEQRSEVRTVWEADLRQALRQVDKPVPGTEDLRKRIKLLQTEDEILDALEHVEGDLFSFDYETTGLRAVAHDLVCASYATDPDQAYAFMFRSQAVKDAWLRIMLRDDIGKISHNLKFEYEWTRAHFGVERINWAWDSMIAAHVVDNRQGICSLKHQAFLNFGVPSYDRLILPYLESTNKRDPSAKNRIYEFIDIHGEDELLIYCGLDSLLAFRLAMLQREIIYGRA